MPTQRDLDFLRAFASRFTRATPMHIVVLDPDQSSTQRMLGALRPKYTASAAATAREALSSLDTQRSALLITELDLPDMSGVDLLRTLRANLTLRHVLLMVVTSRNSVRDKIAALQAGADDYLVKPVDPHLFAEHVERLSRFRQVTLTEG